MTDNDLDARHEHALLGAVLTGYRDVTRLSAIVAPDDFDSPHHETIWRAILSLADSGAQPDPVLVADWLTRTGDISRVGGHLYLHALTEPEYCPVAFNAPTYAYETQRAAAARRLQSAAVKMAQLTERGEPEEVVAGMRRTLEEAARVSAAPAVFSLADALVEFIDDLDSEHIPGPEWPWPDLNRLVSSLDPGMLVIVGARPGVGKSLMGTGTADHVARVKGHRVLLASLEMPQREVLARLVAARARVNLSDLLNRRVNDAQHTKVVQAYAELTSAPLDLDDTPSQTVAHISARAARHGAQVIVVDYAQLVKPADPKLPRVEQLSQITRDLKLMARDRNACVIAMGQVNRSAVGRSRPTMSDLRESGSLENDADVVIMLDPVKDTPELTAYVDKNRNGPCGELTLLVQGHFARLASVMWTPHDAAQGAA